MGQTVVYQIDKEPKTQSGKPAYEFLGEVAKELERDRDDHPAATECGAFVDQLNPDDYIDKVRKSKAHLEICCHWESTLRGWDILTTFSIVTGGKQYYWLISYMWTFLLTFLCEVFVFGWLIVQDFHVLLEINKV